ncbi:MAG: glycosyltransferase, partial [Opitutales bacterium]
NSADLEASLAYKPYLDNLFIGSADCLERNQGRFSQVSLLQFAVNPRIFENRGLPRESKLYFCGNRTTERQEALSKVTSIPTVVRGRGWKNYKMGSGEFDIKANYVNLHGLVAAYNHYLFFFNMIQSPNDTSGLNMRSYEVPACGGLLVCEYDKELEYTLKPGKELLTFVEPNEINDLLERCLKDESYAKTIAENGQGRVLAEHTYENRMKQVLSLLA